MAELLYVANHITQGDCRRLIAALHADSYELDFRIAQVGLVLPETTSCIDLLIHWNSSPGEGRGKTHEILSRRLRQLGQHTLATWLSKTVFSQLAKHLDELELTTACPYAQTLNTEEVPTTIEVLEDFEEEIVTKRWTPFDSVWLAALAVLATVFLTATLMILSKFVSKKLKGFSTNYKYSSLIQV